MPKRYALSAGDDASVRNAEKAEGQAMNSLILGSGGGIVDVLAGGIDRIGSTRADMPLPWFEIRRSAL